MGLQAPRFGLDTASTGERTGSASSRRFIMSLLLGFDGNTRLRGAQMRPTGKDRRAGFPGWKPMATDDRQLLKPQRTEPTEPWLQLDDASDRVVTLAGDVIRSLQDDVEPDREDVEDLRTALDELEAVLDDVADGGA